jgi:outer membrane immunogenic protein
MKRLASFAAAGLCVGLSAAASAADLGRPPPAPFYTKAPIAVPFSWTGYYIGLNAGGHWGHDSDPATVTANTFWFPQNLAIMDAALPTTLSQSGFVGGAQLGYNWQVSSFVFGGEADIMGLSGSASRTRIIPWLVSPQQATLGDSANDRWMATLRARAGFAFDRILIYGTGGGAVANWAISHSYSDNFPLANTPLTTTQLTTTRSGWTAGGGIEYAVTTNWSVRGEYLYADFGTAHSNLTFINPFGVVPSGATIGHADHLTESLARAAVSYKF